MSLCHRFISLTRLLLPTDHEIERSLRIQGLGSREFLILRNGLRLDRLISS